VQSSTGARAPAAALGIGGVPKGRIIEIYGPESSGKTTLALHIVAQAQKRGGGQTELLLSELSDCLPGGERPEAQLDAQAVTLTIEAYLRTQTRENRQLFVRRYYYGDSVRRLSGLFGLSENTVKSRLFRLRAGLRDALLKEGIAV